MSNREIAENAALGFLGYPKEHDPETFEALVEAILDAAELSVANSK